MAVELSAVVLGVASALVKAKVVESALDAVSLLVMVSESGMA